MLFIAVDKSYRIRSVVVGLCYFPYYSGFFLVMFRHDFWWFQMYQESISHVRIFYNKIMSCMFNSSASRGFMLRQNIFISFFISYSGLVNSVDSMPTLSWIYIRVCVCVCVLFVYLSIWQVTFSRPVWMYWDQVCVNTRCTLKVMNDRYRWREKIQGNMCSQCDMMMTMVIYIYIYIYIYI